MTVDDKIMIEFADWVLEVVENGLVVNNFLAQNKLSGLMLKYEEEIENSPDCIWIR